MQDYASLVFLILKLLQSPTYSDPQASLAPQASQQLNPALLTRMLIPVQLYIFINHIGTVSESESDIPFQIEPLTFFYLCSITTSSIVIDSSWEWLHHRTLYDKLWGPVFSCYNLMFFRRNSHFFGKWFPAPLEKMARSIRLCFWHMYGRNWLKTISLCPLCDKKKRFQWLSQTPLIPVRYVVDMSYSKYTTNRIWALMFFDWPLWRP